MECYKVVALRSLLFFFTPTVIALSSITPNQSIHYNETLVSVAETFVAGFFSFGNSPGGYFGIWYKSLAPKTIVWVANRDSPLKDSSGVFGVTDSGNLVVLDGTGVAVWTSNASTTAEKPVVQLLDSGNLVVKDGDNTQNLWQSFDYPGDTLLPGMMLRTNLASGLHTSLTCWTNTEDPGPGDFSYHIDNHGYPQIVITKGATLLYRLGSWNGIFVTGIPWETLNEYFNYSFVLTEQDVFFKYEVLSSSIVSRYLLNPSGLVQRFIWSDQIENWQLFLAGPVDQCDNYEFCGTNSNCDINISPICECLRGFVPKSQEKWHSSNWTDGCVRRVNLDCDDRDGFLTYSGVKLPDTSSSWYDKNLNLDDCQKLCLKNCSCTAFSNLDIRNGGSGCLLWFNDIKDIRKINSKGQDLHIRVAASELDHINTKKHLNKKQLTGIIVGSLLITGIVLLVVAVRLSRKKLWKSERDKVAYWKDQTENKEKEDIDIPTFDFETIAISTNYFALSNKLGEGGFGPVYKGILTNGQEIAVKRLSHKSGQGPEEFKNEVQLIANLQHRNLVKLLGCCIQDDERLLIYEFMPNRSLDIFIFDHTRSHILDWSKRFQIISGIARGLLYLHEDSRLRIIHRDLKVSNILLDFDMNPKISDFGLARTFGGDHTQANTKRVMGTHGYMPPEYAVYGSFSVKSDVFSFGVIILEIVSGRKNREFFDTRHHLNLLGHAWRLWNEERPLELMDESLGDTITQTDVLRSIHIGLLCVQERPEDRPDMSSVILMLNGERPLPRPMQPAFYPHQQGSSSEKLELSSTNEMSITLLQAR